MIIHKHRTIANDLIMLMHIKTPSKIVEDLRTELNYHIGLRTLYRAWEDESIAVKPFEAKKDFKKVICDCIYAKRRTKTKNVEEVYADIETEKIDNILEEIYNYLLAAVEVKLQESSYKEILLEITKDVISELEGLTDPNPVGGMMILQTTRRGLQRNE